MSARLLMVPLLAVLSFDLSGQTTFWNTSTIPPGIDSDTSSVTIGLKFYSQVAGTVTGVRFYKGTGNTGTHTGQLWSASGAKLAEVTFANETASGWQQALFSTPVNITANTTYVVSYVAPYGRYAVQTNYPWSTLTATSLRPSGSAPGVYTYGSGARYPSSTWNASNYWVDVIFTGTTSTSSGGSLWSTSALPTTRESSDTRSVTVGVKFYSDVAGTVTGVRFYKGSNNIGAHVGHLWSATGTKLAEAVFTSETASGWQQVKFSTPVAITAKTTYVVSYLAPVGRYALDTNYAWSSVNATPLHVSGSAPGVYAYGSTGTFPVTSSASNYWVDLMFVAGSSSTPPPSSSTFTISGTVSGSPATLTLSGKAGATTSTDSTGKYLFSGLANGSYVVAPSRSGYVFSPSTASVSVSGANVSGVNFTATTAPVSHSVTLSWTASTSTGVVGYNVYRATVSGGPYTKLTGSPVSGTSWIDSSVAGGKTYYYVTTAVDGGGMESAYSTSASAAVPL